MASGSVVEGWPGTEGCRAGPVRNAYRAARHAAIAIYKSIKEGGVRGLAPSPEIVNFIILQLLMAQQLE